MNESAWKSNSQCLVWAERKVMMTDKMIRRATGLFVITDLINAFGDYETVYEIDETWNTVKYIMAPTDIHVRRPWDDRMEDCCTLADFFDFILPHISGPDATKIKRARCVKYIERAMNNTKGFVCRIDQKTQENRYCVSHLLFAFGMYRTIQMASRAYTVYKGRLACKGEKLPFEKIANKDICSIDEFFDRILPNLNIFPLPRRQNLQTQKNHTQIIDGGSDPKRFKPQSSDVTRHNSPKIIELNIRYTF